MMIKKLIFVSTLVLSAFTANSQITIAAARAAGVGQTVTIRGIVTNGSELGSIRYIQDGTAGIAVFSTAINSVVRYDSIMVTGQITEFNGLLEISNSVVLNNNYGQANVIPSPLQVPITAVNETIEGQYIRIDNVTFVQSGNFAAGSTTVQVTDGSQNLDVRINGSTNIDGTAIPTGPVSIFGLVGQFNTNYQIVPRAVNDIIAYVAPTIEINVSINTATVLTGTNYFNGNTTTIPVKIENFGVNNMTISSANFTGPDAGNYSITIPANTIIAGGTSQTFNVTFTPGTPGSKFATLNINNDDADENPYLINFEGVGTDNLATQPTTNATNIVFNNVKTYTLAGSYTAGTGATKYLVLWKNGSPITGVPVDGTTYLRGDVVGDANVAYSGTSTAFTPRGIIANQTYYFAVYAYNGQGGFENYLTTTPATGNVTSLGQQINNYYNTVDANVSTFINDLGALVNPHTMISYFNYKQTMIAEFEAKDTVNGDSYVTCAYSGQKKVYTGSFDWTANNFSREHVYAHSWMPSNPADSPEKPEYTDQHNLLPTNFSNVNSVRSNYPLGVVVTVQSTYLGAKFGLNANGETVYEPRDDMKGNAARSMMYEAIAYNGINGQNWKFKNPISNIPFIPYGQDQDVLKQWHMQDLPDNYEIARNEYIYNVQGNRNPFIDSVDYACRVDFTTMNYISSCNLGINENTEVALTIYPNPADNQMFVNALNTNIISYTLVDMQGREVQTSNLVDDTFVTINVSQFEAGTYVLKVDTAKGSVQKMIVVR